MSYEDQQWFRNAQDEIQELAKSKYEHALKLNIAKEQARFLLPLSTTTKLYMHGTIRSWLTYVDLRCKNGTQKEHADIAIEIQKILIDKLPTICKAMEWV